MVDVKTICKHCGNDRALAGTKMCDGCWELDSRVRHNPALAAKVLFQCGMLSPRNGTVLPHLQSDHGQQGEMDFELTRQYVLRNYSIYEIAGAFINATSGDIYKRLSRAARGLS